ncbi:tRNA (guanosine(46)-N7)-methyltransferase TrmB [Sulfurovum sp. bin170]|uniref:tRNA (guanosine(46)-N7)-methyltransferase TrmB n=1 Tax=Sulfurovum sp. bin170 TaxID=2695268 RepID=UPI0013DEA257|nr:tRNA (guanosine(46)-N7)-methyltransferase TrmB [Sulfurovum sp. bin170]NEW61036.1 tRNA (guanosine(46)-N7)-methyltransferase TrmB [Sulfurovum sp. bin170]
MPHITVKPFDTSILKEGDYSQTKIVFRSQDLYSLDEMIGVEVDETKFLLHIKKSKESWLLKYDKVTRPLKVNLVKQAIGDISKDLEIINSNITIHKSKVALGNSYEKRIEDFVDIEFPLEILQNSLESETLVPNITRLKPSVPSFARDLFESVSIEVGFGSGKHLLYQAEKNPDRLFIGIEIHTPSAQQVLRQIELKGIENIWVVNYDARLLLEMIPSNLCHKIFVHFPVPWDKKPHRRVISSSFLEESMRVLEKGGKLELRTDSYKYFWYALDTFLGENVAQSALEVRKNASLEVTSKYEARWIRQEKDIYDVFVKSEHQSEERVLDFNFNFDEIFYKDKLIERISKKPILYDGYFIHFERIYRVSESAILLKLAFGSFDRPEHKYIWIDDSICYYFGSIPVKTLTNYKTHLKIKEQLSV